MTNNIVLKTLQVTGRL